jgi:phage terminase Nu1 subunit (DNA packaging protein)
MPIDTTTTANVAELAQLFRVHRHTVESWLTSGMPSVVGGNQRREEYRVNLADSCAWVLKHYQAKVKAATAKRAAKAPEGDARERKLVAEARIKELEAGRREGRLVEADSVEARWVQILSALREGVLAVPGAAVQAGLVEPRRAPELDGMLRDALEAFGRAEPAAEDPEEPEPEEAPE